MKEVEKNNSIDVSGEDSLTNVEEREEAEKETRENAKVKSAEKASKPVIDEVDVRRFFIICVCVFKGGGLWTWCIGKQWVFWFAFGLSKLFNAN